MELMKVGELAKRTGLTVRTLHHYDEVGLLRPGERTASGHRLYGEPEVRRLQQIASLKHLGVPLAEIRACLERPEYSLAHVLEMQVERIEEQIGRQARLRDQIRDLLTQLTTGEAVSVDDLVRTIQVTIMYEQYYTPEQLEKLGSRREEFGQARMKEVQQEWTDIYAGFARAMAEDVDPGAPEVRSLVDRSAALIQEFTGGDPGIARSLDSMYQSEGGEQVLGRFGFDLPDGLFDYMSRARAAAGADSSPGRAEGAAG